MNEIEQNIQDIKDIVEKAKEKDILTKEQHKELSDKLSAVIKAVNEGNMTSSEQLYHLIELTASLPKNLKQEYIKVANYPEHMKVSNLDEIKIPKEVDIKRPEWIKELSNDDILQVLALIKAKGIDVNVTNEDPKRPISVRLSDGQKFYKAVASAVAGAVNPFKNRNHPANVNVTDAGEVETLLFGLDYRDGNSGIDSATESLMTVSYEHHEIHSGSHFFLSGYNDLAQNNVVDFTLLTPNTTKWLHFTYQIETESETNWFIYEGVTATNPLANSLTPLNNNRNSANTSGATVKYEVQTNLAGANADTDVSGATTLDSGISGAGRLAGGSASRDNEIILKQNTLYCFRAIASSAGYINFDMEWYEHTNKN